MEPLVVWTDAARARLCLDPIGAPGKPVHRRGLLADLADVAASWPGPESSFFHLSEPLGGWRELRRRVARADPETRAEARARAETLRAPAELALRCVLSFLFPGEGAWARADAEACLAMSYGQPLHAELLLGSIDDPEVASRLLERLLPGLRDPGAAALELVLGLGVRAAPVLASLAAALEKEKRRKTDLQKVLEAVALLRSDEAAAILAARLGQSEVKAIAGKYFRGAPALALGALAPVAGGRTKLAEVARAILSPILAEHPELSAAMPALSATGRRAVAAVKDRTEVRAEEASAEETPSLLVRPPWRHNADRRLAVFEDLPVSDAPLPVDPRLHARDAWATKLSWVPPALVFSPRVALPVAHAFVHRSDDRAAAEAWLDAFPEIAATGLVPAALRDPCAARLDAGRVLRLLAARAPAAVERALARYPEDVRAGVASSVLGIDPLHDCPYEPPKLPDFLAVDALPRPLLRASDRAISRPAAQHLLEMMAFAAGEPPYAGVAVVKAACTPESLDAFLWAVVEAWMAAGATARTSWPLEALGAFGGDECARRLAAKVRGWPAERAHARASTGIDVLARIGSDVALMHLGSFAERTRYADLQEQARARLAEAARARGLDAEDLADRLVPDLDLDADGGKVLSFGGRTFRVGFDEHLEPFVHGEQGGALRSLPRPTRADDPDQARAAQATWKAIKTDAEAIAAGQIQRLEQAMIGGRRWSPEVFRALLVGHPLLVHVVRRLLWGTYDAQGALTGVFRVAEDRTFADAGDAPRGLDGVVTVGIPHPLDLAPEVRSAWGSVLADYELVQPFPQIGREMFTLHDEERAGCDLGRFSAREVETGRFFALEHRGYRRAPLERVVTRYSKELPSGHVAWLHLSPGVDLTAPKESRVQTLGPLRLLGASGEPARLGDLSPILFSELTRDVALLVG